MLDFDIIEARAAEQVLFVVVDKIPLLDPFAKINEIRKAFDYLGEPVVRQWGREDCKKMTEYESIQFLWPSGE